MIAHVSLAAVYFAGAGAAAYLAVRSWHRDSPVGKELTWFAVCVAQWSFFYALESLSRSPGYRELWSQFAYIGTYGSVVFMVRFCVRWLRPRLAGAWMSLLWIVPVFMVVAAFTNPLHGLVWTDVRPAPVDFVYEYVRGPLFWVGAVYAYLLIASSTVLVAVAVTRRTGIYRKQALFVLCGIAVATGGNLVYVSGALGSFSLDVTPLALAVSAGFLLAGVSRARLLELVPAARHRVVDVMPDGLMVLDEEFRVVDWNQAAVDLWRLDRSALTGVPIAELVPGWEQVVPADPPDLFSASLEQGEDFMVCHHIDVELCRFSGRGGFQRGWIALFHDSTELRATERSLQEANARLEALNRELARQAVHDSLTGLYNRSYLDEALPRELAQADRHGASAGGTVGLLILDVDHFKQVNDLHGHAIGDRVLMHVAALVRDQVRAGDIPCRYGGDELVVVMPGASSDESVRVGRRICDSMAATPFAEGQMSVAATVSLGVAVYPVDAMNATDLLRQADRALYAAKNQGRNRVVGADGV